MKVEEWLESDSDFHPSEDQAISIQEAIRDLEWHESPAQNPLIKLLAAARQQMAAQPDNTELADALKPFEFIREPKAEEVML
jgi:hypothetical protein